MWKMNLYLPVKESGSLLERRIARAHTLMLFSLGVQWIIFLVGGWLWPAVIAFPVTAWAGLILARESMSNWAWVYSLGLLVPGVQFLAVVPLNEFAIAFLKARNIKTGVFGAYYSNWALFACMLGIGLVTFAISKLIHGFKQWGCC